MDLQTVYTVVDGILNTIAFNELFEGFHKYRFALYNSKEIVLDGNILPYQEGFRGNTALEYEGEYLVIWNMEADFVEDPERLAYCLVHEMFHCHQRARREHRYPSEFALLNYPDDVENFMGKYSENRYLAQAYEGRDIEALRKFAALRAMRHQKHPSMVCQEWKVETLEGMAEYVGLKALRHINGEKYRSVVGEYLEQLKAESDLLFDVRRMSYFTGTIFFLCLERLGYPVRNDFASDKTAYEQNYIHAQGVAAELLPCDFVAGQYRRLQQDRRSRVEAHIRHAKYIPKEAVICGYDPMNMFRVDDVIFCSHFVCLDCGGQVSAVQSAVALKLAEGADQHIVGYYLKEAPSPGAARMDWSEE